MTIRVEDIVFVDGERREVQEIFRASGVTWVRYLRRDGSNSYATEIEWTRWQYNLPEGE